MKNLLDLIPLWNVSVFAFCVVAVVIAVAAGKTVEVKYRDMSLRIEGHNDHPSLPPAD
jgi:hypothetical protein